MEKVNALNIRNNLGEILDRLNDKGEPILVSKGRKTGWFLDWQDKEEKKRFLEGIRHLRKRKKGNLSSMTMLRQLRGYEE